MSTNNKQSGFSTIEGVIAVVLIIAVLGFVGLKLYNHQSKQVNTATSNSHNTSQSPISNNSQNSTPAQQSAPNAGYVVVKEWEVRFKPVEGLTGIEYALTNNNTVQLTTSQLKELDPSCSAQNYPVLGGIVRSSQASVPSSQALGKVGSYYYYYYTPQGVCSDQPDVRVMQTKALASLKASLSSFEAAQ